MALRGNEVIQIQKGKLQEISLKDPFFRADILTCHSKSTGASVAPFHSAVPISHDGVGQHAQYQDHETESFFHFIIYIGAFPTDNEFKIIF